MRYMMFIKHAEHYRAEIPAQGLMDAMEKFVTDSMKSGVLLDTAGLRPTSDAARVRLSGGRISVIDGPFTEAKEIIGGYALVEAKSMEDALAVATDFMEIHRIHWPTFEGECEVRPLEDFEPPKQSEG
jgi:hypothetical protein